MDDTKEVIETANKHLLDLSGHVLDLLTIAKPNSLEAAVNLMGIVSKLSPFLGNLMEFTIVEHLNDQEAFNRTGRWKRQDPAFPDAVFESSIKPAPGIEIKSWFPLATEITARFMDSQSHLADDRVHVCMLAWLPDQLIYGRPKIIDVGLISGLSIAVSRDAHYHNPPGYLVLEPEDTSARTQNLQQTNTNGYKWQGTPKELAEATKFVKTWGRSGQAYQPTPEYQEKLRELIARYPYRLDTNFSKMNRIGHADINDFKHRVLHTEHCGKTIGEWAQLLRQGSETDIQSALRENFDITGGYPEHTAR